MLVLPYIISCIKVTFNLVTMQQLVHRATDDRPSFHLAGYLAPKACGHTATPFLLPFNFSPDFFFRLKLFGAVYKE